MGRQCGGETLTPHRLGRSHDGGRVYDTPMPEPETQNRKHGFFSKQWKRRSIVVGLGVHFSIWWVISVWLWRSHWNWATAAWYTLIAPVELGVFYLRQPHVSWTVGTIGLIATACLLGFTIFSTVKRNRWIVLLTHLFIPIYWFWGCALLAAGE